MPNFEILPFLFGFQWFQVDMGEVMNSIFELTASILVFACLHLQSQESRRRSNFFKNVSKRISFGLKMW